MFLLWKKIGYIAKNCSYWIADGYPSKPAKAKFLRKQTNSAQVTKGSTLVSVNAFVSSKETSDDNWYIDNGVILVTE